MGNPEGATREHTSGWSAYMASRKSPEQSIDFYVKLLVCILRDTAQICCLGPSFRKDIETLRERSKSEGFGFLTKTLPSFGKTLDKCLSKDVTPASCSELWHGLGFPCSKKDGFPLFLGDLWRLIFNTSRSLAADPVVNPHAEKRKETLRVNAVRAIRQICFCLYKLEIPYDTQLEADVLQRFREVDESLPLEEDDVPLSLRTRQVLDSARLILAYVLRDFDPYAISPAHGPGAVADGEKPWEKMNFRRFFVQLDKVYPYTDYFFYNYTHLCDDMDTLELLSEHDSACAKVALVPKDSRGPRIISMEPLEIQWIQQGLGRALVNHLEHPGTLTSGFVNFTNQFINRGLAERSSIDGVFDTLDMKDASDRVSSWLVRKLYSPYLCQFLFAARSQYTRLPGGDRISLRKFAPMGSALCFPIEALTFWALAVSSVQTFTSWRGLRSLPEVYVYGDDLVVPHGMYEKIAPVFEELFLKFNEDKCCTGRFFRESCGMDAFMGSSVTPTRVKAPWSKSSPAAALSYVAYSNELREKGYTSASDFIRSECVARFGAVPLVHTSRKYQFAFRMPDWDVQLVEEYLRSTFPVRYNKHWQRTEIRIPLPTARVFTRGAPDWSEMLRLHGTWGSSSPFGSAGEVLRACSYTVPHTVKMRGTWVDLLDLLS